MFSRKAGYVGTKLGLAALLVVSLAGPADAWGPAGRGEAREVVGGFMERAFAWLGLASNPAMTFKCDQGSQIDPNGCPRKEITRPLAGIDLIRSLTRLGREGGETNLDFSRASTGHR